MDRPDPALADEAQIGLQTGAEETGWTSIGCIS
jgi:hypothetical protein